MWCNNNRRTFLWLLNYLLLKILPQSDVSRYGAVLFFHIWKKPRSIDFTDRFVFISRYFKCSISFKISFHAFEKIFDWKIMRHSLFYIFVRTVTIYWMNCLSQSGAPVWQSNEPIYVPNHTETWNLWVFTIQTTFVINILKSVK